MSWGEPIPVLLVFSLAVLLVYLPYLLHERRRRKLGAIDYEPRCPTCGYLIRRGVPLRCSECGADLAVTGLINRVLYPPRFPIYMLLFLILVSGALSFVVGLLAAVLPFAWQWEAHERIDLPRIEEHFERSLVMTARGRNRYLFVRTESASNVVMTRKSLYNWHNMPVSQDPAEILSQAGVTQDHPQYQQLLQHIAQTKQRLAKGDLPPAEGGSHNPRSGTDYTIDERVPRWLAIGVWAAVSLFLLVMLCNQHRQNVKENLRRRLELLARTV